MFAASLSAVQVVLAVTVVIVTGSNAAAENRVALVIGNSKYSAVSELANPRKDAIAVGKVLRDIGYDVQVVEDLDQNGLLRALKEFSDLSIGAEISVVYYAGHGVEVGGRNYLVPTDAVLSKATDVEFEAVPLDSVRTAVSAASELRVVILDACRNNPFKLESADGTRSVHRGLSRVEAGSNELVAYSAREGTLASDGTGTGNSPYATAFLKYLAEPGLEVRLLFGGVHDEVKRATANAQEPVLYSSLGRKELYLNPPRQARPQGPDQQTKRLPEKGSESWAAIAYEDYTISRGTIFGFSSDASSKAEAVSAAIDECKKKSREKGYAWECVVTGRSEEGYEEPVIRDGCLSLYSNTGGVWRFAKGSTEKQADGSARSSCIEANARQDMGRPLQEGSLVLRAVVEGASAPGDGHRRHKRTGTTLGTYSGGPSVE